MAKSVKRRVTRVGPKHRMWITLEEGTFETLRASGEKLGYSISALVQRTIGRGVRAGLIDEETPNEKYCQLTEERCRLHEDLHRVQSEHIESLEDRLALKDQEIARQHQTICEYETAIHGPYKGDQAWRDAQARGTDGDEV